MAIITKDSPGGINSKPVSKEYVCVVGIKSTTDIVIGRADDIATKMPTFLTAAERQFKGYTTYEASFTTATSKPTLKLPWGEGQKGAPTKAIMKTALGGIDYNHVKIDLPVHKIHDAADAEIQYVNGLVTKVEKQIDTLTSEIKDEADAPLREELIELKKTIGKIGNELAGYLQKIEKATGEFPPKISEVKSNVAKAKKILDNGGSIDPILTMIGGDKDTHLGSVVAFIAKADELK